MRFLHFNHIFTHNGAIHPCGTLGLTTLLWKSGPRIRTVVMAIWHCPYLQPLFTSSSTLNPVLWPLATSPRPSSRGFLQVLFLYGERLHLYPPLPCLADWQVNSCLSFRFQLRCGLFQGISLTVPSPFTDSIRFPCHVLLCTVFLSDYQCL